MVTDWAQVLIIDRFGCNTREPARRPKQNQPRQGSARPSQCFAAYSPYWSTHVNSAAPVTEFLLDFGLACSGADFPVGSQN